MRAWLLALAIVLASPPGLAAQSSGDPDSGGLTKSMGLPLIWKPYLGWEAGAYRPTEDTQFGVLADVGVFKDLFNPTIGGPGLQGEGYIGARESGPDGGLRALLAIPMIRLGLGADYNFRDASLDFLFRISAPLRRRSGRARRYQSAGRPRCPSERPPRAADRIRPRPRAGGGAG